MTDAGFFRGTSADQDNRFADKQKKLLKELNFSPILNTKLNMSRIDLEALKPWIEQKIKEILAKDDEILSESIYEHLSVKEPDGKSLLLLLTGLVEEDSKASKFMEELWTKLIDIQQDSNGLSPRTVEASSPASGPSGNVQTTKEQTQTDPPNPDTHDTRREKTGADNLAEASGDRKSRSRTPQPQQQISSKPRSRSNSSSHHSRSVSRSGSKTPSRSRSKSDSRSRHSVSRSRSRSRSTSKSRHTKSRSRSPHYRSNRFRRSRSRSGSYRSSRGRRGYIPRVSYRGSFGYQDRRRGGPLSLPRDRRVMSPPWSRRRSPSYRRRRSPSRSPRRRSRSPMYRRRRSRTPTYGQMLRRPSPRSHGFHDGPPPPPPPIGPMGGGRHMPPHDIHRPVMPPRSPRGPPIDYKRGYGDSGPLPGHSPGRLIGSHDLPSTSHGLSSGPPRPLGSGAYSPRSPSSDKKSHKKEKKHRKHKKSKKRHSSSSSPERRKKHKKHKKSKKHKS